MNLVAEAERIAGDLALARREGDQLRRLPDAVWKQLLEGGFLRSLQPRRWGGGEVHLVEFVDAIIALSRADPSAGWVAGVIGVHPWQLALFDDRAQQEMWGDDPTTMHSSSYYPTGKAERVEGGFKVWGRWSFSSGCDHCRGVNLGAIVPAGETPELRSFLLLADQYQIDDNWHVAGLKATGSKDIVVEETFVPDYRTQSHLDYARGASLPGQDRNDGPLYRLPFSVVFNMALAASIVGSASGFVDEWIDHTKDRVAPGIGRLANDPLIQRRLAEASWDVEVAVSLLRSDAQTMSDRAEAFATPSMEDRAHLRWNMNRAVERVADACVALYRVASGRAAFVDHPLHSRFQDLQSGLGHAFLVPDPLAKAVGGALLGTDMPEFVL